MLITPYGIMHNEWSLRSTSDAQVTACFSVIRLSSVASSFLFQPQAFWPQRYHQATPYIHSLFSIIKVKLIEALSAHHKLFWLLLIFNWFKVGFSWNTLHFLPIEVIRCFCRQPFRTSFRSFRHNERWFFSGPPRKDSPRPAATERNPLFP